MSQLYHKIHNNNNIPPNFQSISNFPGNILLSNFENSYSMRISDFGLSKLIGVGLSDVPHDLNFALKICNGLRPKIPFHTPKSITRMIMRWKNKDTEIVIQIKKAEEFSENQNHSRGSIGKNISHIFHWKKESTNKTNSETATTTHNNNQTHPQAIYTSRLNFLKLSKPKNEENFEKELEELTKSTSVSSAVASKLYVPDF
ncbi:hypothetical protein Glove_13g64 [Diversispora epigaea]|uniref:Protein kinase domain-containing protein n=1 Tax=Diversispora epigaea TaxID=1348612 RepID=A0A397JW57_9GLOM|nr:hypothetical protein Glove_13g64 [Diversispora epigaea]